MLLHTDRLMSFPRQDYTVPLSPPRRIASRTATGCAGWSHPAGIGTSATPSVTETLCAACLVSSVTLDQEDEQTKEGHRQVPWVQRNCRGAQKMEFGDYVIAICGERSP